MVDASQWRVDKAARLARGEAKDAPPAQLPIGVNVMPVAEEVPFEAVAEATVEAVQSFAKRQMKGDEE